MKRIATLIALLVLMAAGVVAAEDGIFIGDTLLPRVEMQLVRNVYGFAPGFPFVPAGKAIFFNIPSAVPPREAMHLIKLQYRFEVDLWIFETGEDIPVSVEGQYINPLIPLEKGAYLLVFIMSGNKIFYCFRI